LSTTGAWRPTKENDAIDNPLDINRSGTQPSGKGPASYFTGTVRIDPLASPPEPVRVAMALLTFEPGARTVRHTHPLGQTLIVAAGCGRVQRKGELLEEIRLGGAVSFPPGEKHWHDAAPTAAMSHITIQDKLNGSPADWMEHVTDAQHWE
jgi:quercetin dioxygenase-like cupin family protein